MLQMRYRNRDWLECRELKIDGDIIKLINVGEGESGGQNSIHEVRTKSIPFDSSSIRLQFVFNSSSILLQLFLNSCSILRQFLILKFDLSSSLSSIV